MSIAATLTKQGKGIVNDLRNSFAAKGVNASGSLSRSLKSTVTSDANTVRLVVDAWDYVFEVEEGTPPRNLKGYKNKPPKFFVDLIEIWIAEKRLPLFSGFRDKTGMAWAIATTVNRSGTRRHSKGIKSGAISDVINEDLIREIENQLADDILADALNALTKVSRN